VGSEFELTREEYEKQLMRGVSLSGQNRDYFIRWRIKITKSLLTEEPKRILDFGCGEGASFPFFKNAFSGAEYAGFEPSNRLIESAKKNYQQMGAKFCAAWDEITKDGFDLIYTNGVFHHIKPEERLETLIRIRNVMNQKGKIALWENNPWHPGTRLVMSRIVFDRDAQTISPSEAKHLIRSAGFEVTRLISAFHLPFLEKLPWLLYQKILFNRFGAQYLILAEKEQDKN